MPPPDFTDLHRTACWGCSPTEYADFTELLAEDVLPQIAQIYTELLAEDVLPQISQIYTEAANFRLVYFLLGWCTSCYVGALLALASGKAERRQVHLLEGT